MAEFKFTKIENAIIKTQINNIRFIKLTPSLTKFYFANNNGENVFKNTKLPICEFGYAFTEHANAIEFYEQMNDDHAAHIILNKNNSQPVNLKNKASAEFFLLFIAKSIDRACSRTRATSKTSSKSNSSTKALQSSKKIK